jgi:hypothetical protein
MSEHEAVFSKAVSSGRKKYYMDVKKAKNGCMYLTIKEVIMGDAAESREQRRIMIFDDTIRDFAEAFELARKFMPHRERPKQEAQKAAV